MRQESVPIAVADPILGRGKPLTSGTGQPVRTDGDGRLFASTPITTGDSLVALWPTGAIAKTGSITSLMPWVGLDSLDSFPITVTNSISETSLVEVESLRRIGEANVWVAITSTQLMTLPSAGGVVSLTLTLQPPQGAPISLLSSTQTITASNLYFTSSPETSLIKNAADTQVVRVDELAGLRGMLAEGNWRLQVEKADDEPVALEGWGLDLRQSLLFYTSAAPSKSGLKATPASGNPLQQLEISKANPLLLFDLDVALEWDASYDSQYLAQLKDDLRRASEVLYDWSNGQLALGDITVYEEPRRIPESQGFQPWRDAHIRIYASNNLRPSSAIGGIVSQEIPDPDKKEISYWPGQLFMGANVEPLRRYAGQPGRRLAPHPGPRTQPLSALSG